MTLRPGNAQHQGAREYQQDSFAFSDLDDRAFVAHGGVLAVIADGMGGLAHGGEAGALAVRTFLQRYQAKAADQSIPQALNAALEAANDAVLALARQSGEVGNVGATLVAAVVHAQSLHWISVGDSRAYLLRGGRVDQITADHVYAAELDRRRVEGKLTEEQARSDPDRDALTSHLGKTRLTLVDRSVRPLPLEAGDRVLLCTDGLYRGLTNDEIAAVLADDPQRACERLIDGVVAKHLPGQDNVTAIALAVEGGAAHGATTTHGGTADAPIGSSALRRSAPAASVATLLLLIAAGACWRVRHDRSSVPLPPSATRPNASTPHDRGSHAPEPATTRQPPNGRR